MKRVSIQRRINHSKWLWAVVWLAIGLLCALRFWALAADFPNHSPWMIDQAKFTDEGWWDNGAVMHHLTGRWYVAGDYNPSIAVPVWPLLLATLFHWTGVSIIAARALNVAISIGVVGLVYVLLRRESGVLAALLVASSPFAFVYSRLAVLDTLVIFEFCLGMVLASRRRALAWLPLVVIAMVFTKTTAIVLVPAIICMAWLSMGRTAANLLRVCISAVVAPAVLYAAYRVATLRLGYGPDYSYFFSVNATEDIDWRNTFAVLRHLAADCLWVDRILYPAAVACLAASAIWLRGLWSRPLFFAAWVALAGQLVFLFRISDVYAPRHFLTLLVPMVFIVVLAVDEMELRSRRIHLACVGVLTIAAIMNAATVVRFNMHWTYALYGAARSIQNVLAKDSQRNRMLLGVSGAQLGLMAGEPSICDVYGTEPLDAKVRRYDPEWLITWNGIGDEDRAALSAYRLNLKASYPVFDDDQRNLLMLYQLQK